MNLDPQPAAISSFVLDACFDLRTPQHLLRAYLLAYHWQNKVVTIPHIAKSHRHNPRTLRNQLYALKCMGMIEMKPCGPRGVLLTPLPPAISNLKSPISNLQSQISNPPDEDTSFMPDAIARPVSSAAASTYHAELETLHTHPILKNKISAKWLAYLDRKYQAAFASAKTDLRHLCDSFANDFLRPTTKNAIARKWLDDPKTDWEEKLRTHIIKHVAPDELRRRAPRNPDAPASPKQKKFKFDGKGTGPVARPAHHTSHRVPDPDAGDSPKPHCASFGVAGALPPVIANIVGEK